MFESLKKLFNREKLQDPMAAQRERLLAISARETVESARHPHMHKADINTLIRTIDPDHPGGHVGPTKRKKDAPVLPSWLRAEPNTYPERTPMLYRVFLMTGDHKDRANYAHSVMVSNGRLKKEDVVALFAAWDAEALRIAQLPPEPEEKKEEKKPEEKKAEDGNPDGAAPPPAPPAP